MHRTIPEGMISLNWGQVEKVSNWGFATYVKGTIREGRRYRILLGKDTNGYYRLTDTIRSRYEKVRHSRQRG